MCTDLSQFCFEKASDPRALTPPKCTIPQRHTSAHLKEDLRAQCGYWDRAILSESQSV